MRARAQVVATDDPESRQSYIRLTDADGNVIDVDPGNQSEASLDAEGGARLRKRGPDPHGRSVSKGQP